MKYQENEEKDQDRTDSVDLLYHNKRVYEQIIPFVAKRTVLEGGCGNGAGSFLLANTAHKVRATDKLKVNVDFAIENFKRENLDYDIWDIGEAPYKEKYEVVVAMEVVEHVKKYHQAIQNLIGSALHDVWISTPNRDGLDKKWAPQQEFHVKEFIVQEMLEMIGEHEVEIYHWETFAKLLHIKTVKGQNIPSIKVHPLIYRVIL